MHDGRQARTSCAGEPRPGRRPPPSSALVWWLFAMAGLVFAMVVLGGVTRLSQAGLSMVEWRPLAGALPPLDEETWRALFAQYRQFPEYREVHRGMTLEGFKGIFWLEYAHRLLGRALGAAFLLPFLWFLLRRRLPLSLAARLLAIAVLGGLQGLLGWYMVESGLVDRPGVSPYRLAAHLGLAVVIYAALLWTALGLLLRPAAERATAAAAPASRAWRVALALALGLVFVTLLSGAFVAGNDAGLAYNTFPSMAGALVPPDLFPLEPLWRNFFEHVPLVQLDHRLLAMLTAAVVALIWLAGFRAPPPRPARRALHALAAAVACQFALGVATLLAFVPVPLAAAHQAGAMAAFTACLVALRLLHPRPLSTGEGRLGIDPGARGGSPGIRG